MDKTKIFEVAGKFASKGQLDKAAKEYQRVLDVDPKDVRALQKLAELYQKSGRFKESTDLMLRVAEGYTEQGFFLKAVAVYKQVLKLGQERIDVNLRLAQLYQQLGLVGDATQQFQLVANFHDKSGNVKESLAALRKMVDLDPDNVASRVKLGELYARERMVGEAVTELRRAATYLKKNARHDDQLRVLERIGQLVPDDVPVAKELAHAFLAQNDTKRALAKLQICFRHNPKDVETLTLLAKAFADLGQEAKTVSVFRELARVYQETNQPELRRQTLERILQLSPEDPEASEALQEVSRSAPAPPARERSQPQNVPPPAVIAPPAPPRPAAAAQGSRAPAPPPPAPRPPQAAPAPAVLKGPAGSAGVSAALAKVLTETDVYLKYGLIQKAADHIQRALAGDPDNFAANEKLLAVLDRQGRTDDAVTLLARLVELARERADADKDSLYTQELAQRAPGHPLVAEAAAAADLQLVADEELIIESDEVEARASVLATEAAGEDIDLKEATGPTSASPRGSQAVVPAAPAPWDTDDTDDTDDGEVVVDAEPMDEAPRRLDLGEDDGFDEALDRATGRHSVTADEGAPTLEGEPDDEIDPFELVSGRDDGDDAVVMVDEEVAEHGAPFGAASTPFGHEPRPEDAFGEPPLAFADEDNESTVVDQRMLSYRAAAPMDTESFDTSPVVTEAGTSDEDGAFDAPSEPAPEEPSFDEDFSAPAGTFGEEQPDWSDGLAAELEQPPAEAPAFDEAPAPFGEPAVEEPAAPDEEPAPPAPSEDEPPAPAAPALATLAGADDALFDEELAEAEFLIQQGLDDDARTALEGILLAAPAHPRALELLRQVSPAEAPAPEERASPTSATAAAPQAPPSATTAEIAHELADELDDLDSVFDSIKKPSAPMHEAPPPDGQYSVSDVLSEFKKQIAVTVSAEDSQTHYDLGIAYKEMGLVEEAIHEFEVALNGRGRRRVIDCLSMLGICHFERDRLDEAVVFFERALKTPGLTLEASKSAHFEIGGCREKLGQLAQALDHYARVYKAEPTFRDVKVRVARVQAKVKSAAPAAKSVPAVGRASMPAPVRPRSVTPAAAAPAAAGPAPGREAPAPPPAPSGRGKIGYV